MIQRKKLQKNPFLQIPPASWYPSSHVFDDVLLLIDFLTGKRNWLPKMSSNLEFLLPESWHDSPKTTLGPTSAELGVNSMPRDPLSGPNAWRYWFSQNEISPWSGLEFQNAELMSQLPVSCQFCLKVKKTSRGFFKVDLTFLALLVCSYSRNGEEWE